MQDILRNKKTWGNWLAVIFMVAIIWLFGIKTPAYSVVVDGQKQFVVEKKADVSSALNQMPDQELGKRVALKLTFVNRDQLVVPENIGAELNLAFQPKVMAASIVVNGQTVVSLPDRTNAEAMLEQLKQKNSSLAPGEKLLSVDFDEQVQVVDANVPTAKVLDWNDAWNTLNLGTAAPQTYSVQSGDSLWTIARKNNMYVSDITQANNLQEDSILALGQQIILNKPQPLITVIAQVEGTETVPIPYQTQTTTDNSISGTKVKTEGQNGEEFVAYTATRRNGDLEDRQVSQENVTKAAVDRVVVKGTKTATYQVASRGDSGGSGQLDWPVYGTITQRFYVGGHTGIDIAGPIGTTICAAASGNVTFAGWDGGYGYFVIINNGNGLVTRYAHCSKLYVSAGQWVNQDQAIAARGSTGNSTGPHTHFEVMQDGSFRNPLNYLH
jgi:murein DD-endopeptidase MepM/ murein hydrolase activator NlpD